MMPNYYNPYQYYPQYYQQQTQQPAPQNSFLTVTSEAEARNYPVGPGNSVTFKDETAPYIYTKTMGFSQLDQPVFDRYKLVKEEVKEEVKTEIETQKEIDKIMEEINSIWGEINALKQPKKSLPKREKDGES